MEITPKLLLERAREVLGATNDWQVAQAIDRSPDTVKNWRHGTKPDFDATIKLLQLVGWLNLDGNAPAVDPRVRQLVRELADKLRVDER
jgi:hypothetical protein